MVSAYGDEKLRYLVEEIYTDRCGWNEVKGKTETDLRGGEKIYEGPGIDHGDGIGQE